MNYLLYIFFLHFNSGGVKELHGHPIAYAFDGVVKDLVSITPNKKTVKKLFYQTLAMPLHELENKKPFKVCLPDLDFLMIDHHHHHHHR